MSHYKWLSSTNIKLARNVPTIVLYLLRLIFLMFFLVNVASVPNLLCKYFCFVRYKYSFNVCLWLCLLLFTKRKKKHLVVRSKKFSFPTCAWNPSGIYPVHIVNLSCHGSFWQADFVGGSFFYCCLLPYMVKRGDSLFTWLKLLWMTAVLYCPHFNLHWNSYLIHTLAAIFFLRFYKRTQDLF